MPASAKEIEPCGVPEPSDYAGIWSSSIRSAAAWISCFLSLALKRGVPEIIMLLILCESLAVASTVQQKEDGSPFRLMLQWMPQSQFAGIYIAEEKGFYEESGVLLEVLRGGPDRDGLSEMKAGRIDFVQTWLSTAIEFHQNEAPVVHLGQFLNRSNATIVARTSRNIKKLEDLDGRKISIWGGPFRPPYQALFSKTGISPVIVPQYYSVNLFLRGGVDACSAMQYNELDMIYLAGVNRDEVTVFFLRDYGVNFPEDGLFCRREFRDQYEGVCRNVAEASMRGWEYAREHPEEALDIVMERVQAERLPTNRTHMRWMLEVVLRSVFPEENDGWTAGELSREDFEITARWLKDQGLIEAIPGYDDFRGQARVP